MKAIGVRDLKAHLSAYLRDVQAGEIILVTDRGRVIAEMRAPGGVAGPESDLDRTYRRLADAGVALRVGEPHWPDAYRPSPVQAPDGTAGQLLDAEREEK